MFGKGFWPRLEGQNECATWDKKQWKDIRSGEICAGE